MTETNIQELINGLNSNASKRRSSAKKLRKVSSKEAIRPLIEALEKEFKSPKAWETQYHMIMAIGNTKDKTSLDYLYSLIKPNDYPHMVNLAIGDAVTRLENHLDINFTTLQKAIDNNNIPIAEGAFRAIALLKLNIGQKLIERIIKFVSASEHEHLKFWPSAAAPAWSGGSVILFLESCVSSEHKDTSKAAKAALQKKYIKWNPL